MNVNTKCTILKLIINCFCFIRIKAEVASDA